MKKIPKVLQKAFDHADSLPDDWFGDEEIGVEKTEEVEYQESKMIIPPNRPCDNCGKTEMSGGMSWMGHSKCEHWCGSCDISKLPEKNPRRWGFEEFKEKHGFIDCLDIEMKYMLEMNDLYIDHLEAEVARVQEKEKQLDSIQRHERSRVLHWESQIKELKARVKLIEELSGGLDELWDGQEETIKELKDEISASGWIYEELLKRRKEVRELKKELGIDYIEIRHVSEIEKEMTPEQKEQSKKMYDKFYGDEFGDSNDIFPIE